MLVSIEKQDDGSYIAFNTDGEGFSAIGTGDTIREAKEDFFRSIEELKESCQAHGDEIPSAMLEAPTFKFDLASFFEYYSFINATAFARKIGINDSLMRQYKQGKTYISELQLQRIQTAINRIGADFQSLRLV